MGHRDGNCAQVARSTETIAARPGATEARVSGCLGKLCIARSCGGLSPNLALVGTVNMDESVHRFSRKVLDRAFTLVLSEIDLT